MKPVLFLALLSAFAFITTAKADHHGQNAPGEMVTCSVCLQHLVMKYQDMAALAQDRERIVTFTRCEIHEDVTGDDMRAEPRESPTIIGDMQAATCQRSGPAKC